MEIEAFGADCGLVAESATNTRRWWRTVVVAVLGKFFMHFIPTPPALLVSVLPTLSATVLVLYWHWFSTGCLSEKLRGC